MNCPIGASLAGGRDLTLIGPDHGLPATINRVTTGTTASVSSGSGSKHQYRNLRVAAGHRDLSQVRLDPAGSATCRYKRLPGRAFDADQLDGLPAGRFEVRTTAFCRGCALISLPCRAASASSSSLGTRQARVAGMLVTHHERDLRAAPLRGIPRWHPGRARAFQGSSRHTSPSPQRYLAQPAPQWSNW